MLAGLVDACVSRRGLVIAIFGVVVLVGILALRHLSIDAIPDIGENQVIVYADWPGRSPKDVEDHVTYPLTVNLMGIPKVKTVRSNSMFGFSLVNIIFEDGVDYYWARTRVLERLDWARKDLPQDVHPVLGPDATLVGQIFWYTVEGEGYDLYTLRALNDWYIKLALQSVSGVAEVASVGGLVREYRVEVDPNKLISYRIPITKVIKSVKESNIDVGAEVIEEGGVEYVLRGVGLIKTIDDIENIVVEARQDVPILVKHLGKVTIGPDFRRGALEKSGKEVTGGVVLMRYGANPRRVIELVKEKIAEIERGLPQGVKIVSFYDRTRLIDSTTRTLKVAVVLQIFITILVVYLLLGHTGTSTIVAASLPIGILATFIVMYLAKMTSNLMSISGIALSIGVMVDSAIIMAENIHKHIAIARPADSSRRLSIVAQASKEVARPIFFSVLIIILAFANIYFLRGEAGRLFRPLAITENLVMAMAALIAISLVPVLGYLLIRGKVTRMEESRMARALVRGYEPTLRWVLRHRKIVLIISIVAVVVAFISTGRIKSEFMPPLNEGDILFMPVLLPGASIDQVMKVMAKQDSIIATFPEVEMVVGKLGRAETPTDPAPVSMIETVIRLKPKDEWRQGMTREKLIAEMDKALRFPGVSNIWTQPIRNRIDMLATGIQTPVGVKIFGPDYDRIAAIAVQVEKVLHSVHGAVNPFAERIGDRPYVEIEVDRKKAARYGVTVGEINSIIATAIGGRNLSKYYKGRERYPISVTFLAEYRDDIEGIKRLPVPIAGGRQVPLLQIASVKRTLGPAMIATENAIPYARVFVNVDTDKTGILDFVNEAKRKVAESVELPPGYFLSWSGQYAYELESRRRLLIVVPLCLMAILIMLYVEFDSIAIAALVFSALPFAFVGGILLQHILGYKFSTAVWVGYIALFGVAVEDGLALVEHLRTRMKTWRGNTLEMVVEGASWKLRPILMTTVTTVLALMPIMLSSGPGSEVMKPIATPIAGGMITATLLNLFILPVLYSLYIDHLKRS